MRLRRRCHASPNYTAAAYIGWVSCRNVVSGDRAKLAHAENPAFPVTRKRKWLARLARLSVVLLMLILGIGIAWLSFMPSNEDLAAKAENGLTSALGAKVTIASLQWKVLPVPALSVEGVVIASPQPISVRHLTLYPSLDALIHKKISIVRAEVDGAVVPQISLPALAKGEAARGGEKKNVSGFTLADLTLSRFVFRDVAWISRSGITVIYDGEIDFDEGWRPRTAELRRPGFKPKTDLALVRQGAQDRWMISVNVGGGTLNGEARLQALAGGKMELNGKLKPVDIEVSSALAAFNRRPAVAGKLSGETTLSARGAGVFALAQSLKTVTPFVMGRSTILHFDLDKAIRTGGKEHGGQTPLDAIAGTLETQNTTSGMMIDFRNIETKSGALSASGDAKLFNQRINAEFAIDIVKGLIGVPLKVTGPVNAISVSVPNAALAGAVAGTVILPGLGTALGARLGAAMGKLFDSGPVVPKSPVPAPMPGR